METKPVFAQKKRRMPRWLPVAIAVAGSVLTGCASQRALQAPVSASPADPLESINRPIYKANKALDALLFKPTAKLYQAVLPTGAQRAVHQFMNNLDDVWVTGNDILQGNFRQASHTATRFVVNSTLGIGGLVDVAARAGSPKRENDLGLTFAMWGFTHSPYVVLPVLGPSTLRDSVGKGVQSFAHPMWRIRPDTVPWSVTALGAVDTRARYLSHEALLQQAAMDEYSLVRDAYLQRRAHALQQLHSSHAQQDKAASADW